jgi:hypothetical protein
MAMLPFAALSRRALVVAVTALVAVPDAVAAKKQKPPLASVAAVVTEVAVGSDGTTFVWSFQAVLSHPESGFEDDLSGVANSGVTDSEKQVRADIVQTLKNFAEASLQGQNLTIPTDRISVVVL